MLNPQVDSPLRNEKTKFDKIVNDNQLLLKNKGRKFLW